VSDQTKTTALCPQCRVEGTAPCSLPRCGWTPYPSDGGRWDGDFYTVPSAFEQRRTKWLADTHAALLRLAVKWGLA
jgi:hypothetical protein